MTKLDLLNKSLKEKNCVKVIAGINNFDIERIKKIVAAAEQGNATAVDIAAREDIIYVVKEMSDLPVFVSSIKPEELEMAARHGADALEIGNYDALYANGLRITSEEVLNITKSTLDLVGNNIMLSVTVPGHIDIIEQINLAQNLEELGVNIIQTEGAAISDIRSMGARGFLEKAQVSIANTIELVRNVNIPVMTASGITVTTAPLAFAAGASAIGIGSCVNKIESTISMIAVIRSIVQSVSDLRSPVKQEALVSRWQ